MNSKNTIKLTVFIVSLCLNALVVFLFILSQSSNSRKFIYYSAPPSGYSVASMIASFPQNSFVSFNPIEIDLYPDDKCLIQFSYIYENKQSNIFLTPLYDRDIIAVAHSPGYGIEITAKSPGSTLLQTISVDGISDIVLVNVLEN